jgi:hypothetical protein
MAGAGSDGVRKIRVKMDYSPSSKKALDWAIANLLHHGDTLVVLHVLHQSHGGDHELWAKSGSCKSKPQPSHTEMLSSSSSHFLVHITANRKNFCFMCFSCEVKSFPMKFLSFKGDLRISHWIPCWIPHVCSTDPPL